MLFFIKFETNVSIKKKKVQFSLIGNNYHFKTKKKNEENEDKASLP
mgnify:CR=1 FL=1